jgi:LPLT family lysophospholipid transporter-like MFS transporter
MNAAVISQRLWSRGLVAVLVAQFLSAMADNALLFGALALLRSDAYPSWTACPLRAAIVEKRCPFFPTSYV